MKTYIVSATCGFDWLHILVRGESFEDAKEKVEQNFSDNNVGYRWYDSIKEKVNKGSTDFVGFYVDEDDIEYGRQCFEVCDYTMEFVVRTPEGDDLDFETQEDALEFIAKNYTYCPSRTFTNRAYYYELMKK